MERTEKRKAYEKQYKKEHREHTREIEKEYWDNHKDKQKEKAKRYYEAHKKKSANNNVNIIKKENLRKSYKKFLKR